MRPLTVLLATIILLFVAAAAYISALIVERQGALEQVSRYNVAWLVSQATTELARLEQRVSAFGLPDSTIRPEEVQLRFDIIVNRLRLLETGEVQEFVATDPEYQDTLRQLAETIAAAQPLVDSIEAPGTPAKLLALLTPLDGKLSGLAAAANRFGGERVAEDQHQLIALHWRFSGLAAGLIACGVLLLILLVWHNALLQRTSSDLNRLNADVQTQNKRFEAALNNMSQGLCMFDSRQQLIICNGKYREMFALNKDSLQPGTAVRELLEAASGVGMAECALALVLTEQQPFIDQRKAAIYFQELADGRTLAVSHQPMPDGGWLATYEDISERRRAEARIAHMAHHDALTDLPNRVLLRERMEIARRTGKEFAILWLDLDRFKGVNDTLGHPVGDALLKRVAERLRACAEPTDIVARLGGDEFAILQCGVAQPASAERLGRRILQAISVPLDLDGQQVVVGTSIGVAVAPWHGATADQLLKNADMALYRAKAEGRGTLRFFKPEMDVELQARRLLELDLRKALAAGEFELQYQPLLDLSTNRITCCEALIRWRHPQRGFVPPGEFISVAEEIGLIVPLGEWVLRQACMQAMKWPSDVSVAVNISSIQLSSRNLPATVVLALAAACLPAKRLQLEITESVFLQDNDLTLSSLHQLRELGVQIAMDDFGTGYSSLSYLRSFPFDKIKLDKSFVNDLSDRSDAMAIVESIALLGRNLGMTTTAEGIETAEQLETVRKVGFVEGQGYFFHRPQPMRELLHILEQDVLAKHAA